jgi:hypothetical protein
LHSFTKNEEREILEIVIENKDEFKQKWYEYFSK